MKIFSIKKIMIAIFMVLIFYTLYWLFISSVFKSKITDSFAIYPSISYDSISLKGFPYRMQVEINNFNLKRDDKIKFDISSPIIKLDINPFDFNRLLLRSNIIEGNIVYEELNLNVKLTEIRSTVLSSEDKIKEYLLIINNADILVNELKINAFKNIFFKIINIENFIYQLNTSAEGSGFIGSDDGQMKIDLNGNYQIKNRNLEGNLQLTVTGADDNQILFNAPIQIKENTVFFLFLPILDLNSLLNFF
jgi:hypothetical protein